MKKKEEQRIRRIAQRIDCKSGLVVEFDVTSEEEALLIADAFYPPIDIVLEGATALVEFCIAQGFSEMVTAASIEAYAQRFIESAHFAQLNIADMRVIEYLQVRINELEELSQSIQTARCKAILNDNNNYRH